jgi:hypothetical protein
VHLKNGSPEQWTAPFFCTKQHFSKFKLSYIRESMSRPLCTDSTADYREKYTNFNNSFLTIDSNQIEFAGWHFSWMGSSSNKIKKLNSFLHWNEFEDIKEIQENATDILGRDQYYLKKLPHNLLPKQVFELPRVKEYLFPNQQIEHIYQNPEFGENWFSYSGLYSNIVEQFSSGSKFVEIGCWKGKSSAYMAVEIANSQKDIEFICIDTWEGSVEHQDHKELKNLYDIFKSNMRPVEKYYKSIKSSSLNAVNLFPDNSIDFVFIDASHEYEDVKNDILAWYPKVKVGGILAGHDYYVHDEFASGVKKAVNEIFKDFEVSENCFIVRKK